MNSKRSPLFNSNKAQCNTGIAQLIHGLYLLFSLTKESLLLNLIRTARLVRKNYMLPLYSAVIVLGVLLGDHYKRMKGENTKQLSINSSVFGLQAMGDGATIRKMHLFNMFAATYRYDPSVLTVHDSSEHLASMGKKDASQTLNIFFKEMEILDPGKDKFDLYIINRAWNVQVTGDIIEAFPPGFL